MAQKPKILVGTPAYQGQVQLVYTRSLLDMTARGIDFSLFTVSNDSLVARARNTVLATFHDNREFTHLFFLDADVGIPGAGVLSMLGHNKDVIGAPVRIKVVDDGKPAYSIGKVLSREGTLAKVSRISTAALMLSRAAVERLVELAVSENRSYPADSMTLGEAVSATHYDVFRQGVRDGQYVSEDYQACLDLQALGFALYADLGVRTSHIGSYEFN